MNYCPLCKKAEQYNTGPEPYYLRYYRPLEDGTEELENVLKRNGNNTKVEELHNPGPEPYYLRYY